MRTRARGLTLLEVVIASAILGMVTLMTYLIVFSSSESATSQTALLALDSRARETLEEIARDLRMSDGNALFSGSPGPKLGPKADTSDLFFYIPGTFDLAAYAQNGNQVVLNQSLRYRWVCDEPLVDGLDNDGDGLVDEGHVEKTDSAGRAVRICPDVPYEVMEFNDQTGKSEKKRAFRFVRDQENVTISLHVETLDPKGGRMPVDPAAPAGPSKPRTLQRRAQTTVELRN